MRAGSSAGRLVAFYTDARSVLLRVMGLASRRDILATQDRIIKSFPEVASVYGKAGRAATATLEHKQRTERTARQAADKATEEAGADD